MMMAIKAGEAKPIHSDFHSEPGMIRFINSSNRGTVNAVSPWLGLQIIPLVIRLWRTGHNELTLLLNICAISPER